MVFAELPLYALSLPASLLPFQSSYKSLREMIRGSAPFCSLSMPVAPPAERLFGCASSSLAVLVESSRDVRDLWN